MKKLIASLGLLLCISAQLKAQHTQNCCDVPACREKMEAFAEHITELVFLLGNFDAGSADIRLKELKQNRPPAYKDFIETSSDIIAVIEDERQGQCFKDKLPEDERDNIYDWLIFMKDKVMKPKFPSAEYCRGFRRRVEIGQGSSDFIRKQMAYLGSLRGYLGYTFGPKDGCGGRFRLMAGPAYFLRDKDSYLALSSRAAVRLGDINPVPFAIGNLCLFGEYNTNFDGFDYAGLGLEIELGVIGLNLAVNHNVETGYQGFLIGLIIANKNFKK